MATINICAASQSSVNQAIKIFGDSFRLTKMSNGRDLVEMVCQVRAAPEVKKNIITYVSACFMSCFLLACYVWSEECSIKSTVVTFVMVGCV